MTQRFPFLFNWKSTLCMHGVDKETFANQRGTNTMFRCSDSIGSCISVLLHCLVRYPIASSRHGPRAPVCASTGPVTYKGVNSLVLTITSSFYTLVKKILNWSFSTLFSHDHQPGFVNTQLLIATFSLCLEICSVSHWVWTNSPPSVSTTFIHSYPWSRQSSSLSW